MYSLIRLLFRALNGKPMAQLIVGIIMIPVGGLLSIVAGAGDRIYPYWIIAGIALVVVGVVFIVRGIKALVKPTPSVQQRVYNAQGQYAPPMSYGQPQQPYAPYASGQPQQPYPYPQAPHAPGQNVPPTAYGQPQQPYPYPQAPYNQPYASGQPYPSEYIPGQQQ